MIIIKDKPKTVNDSSTQGTPLSDPPEGSNVYTFDFVARLANKLFAENIPRLSAIKEQKAPVPLPEALISSGNDSPLPDKSSGVPGAKKIIQNVNMKDENLSGQGTKDLSQKTTQTKPADPANPDSPDYYFKAG